MHSQRSASTCPDRWICTHTGMSTVTHTHGMHTSSLTPFHTQMRAVCTATDTHSVSCPTAQSQCSQTHNCPHTASPAPINAQTHTNTHTCTNTTHFFRHDCVFPTHCCVGGLRPHQGSGTGLKKGPTLEDKSWWAWDPCKGTQDNPKGASAWPQPPKYCL